MNKISLYTFVALVCFFFFWVKWEGKEIEKKKMYDAERKAIIEKGLAIETEKYVQENRDKAWQFVINPYEGVVVYDGFFKDQKTKSIYPNIDYSESTFIDDPNYTGIIRQAYQTNKEKGLKYVRKVVIKEQNGYGESKNLRVIPPEIMLNHVEIYIEAIRAGFGDSIKYVPKEVRIQFPEICMEAMKKSPNSIQHIPQEVLVNSPEMCVMAVREQYMNMRYVPFEIRKNVFETIYGPANPAEMKNMEHKTTTFP